MSTLTHLSSNDRAWALGMLDEWKCDGLGRNRSSEHTNRMLCNGEARDWLRGFDREQAAANAGLYVEKRQAHTFFTRMLCDMLPGLIGTKRTDPATS